ncbi:hypothetical protein I4U23_027370 [Adineta vaga]|nr:hypothetical protein I4U23_027370 [Adineta vaga]
MGSLCSKVSVTPSLTVVNNSMQITTDYETIQVTNESTTNEFIPFDDRTSHISGNFILIWLNLNIDSSNSNIQTYIPRLRTIINSIKIFHNLDECIDFITDLIDEKIFLIISGRITQQFASILHELIEIDSIYLFSNENSSYRQWIEQYQKIKGIFNEIDIICKILRRNVRYLNYNLTPIRGLLSFNNFLSTSFDSEVGYLYADSARQNCQLIGILFYITIDRSISSTPFASIQDLSYFGNAESEILFSMHTVFRIVEVTEIQDRLWQVNLTLTSDNDALLTCIMESIQKTISGNTPLYRLGTLMWYIGQYNEAEVIYERLLKTDTNLNHREIYYIISRLCCMNIVKGDYEKVFSYFENSNVVKL